MPAQYKHSGVLCNTARRLCVAAIIISPWLIGSSDGWAYLLMGVLVGIATIAWLFSLLTSESIKLVAPKVLLAMVLFVLFTACQTIPLPQQILKILNPATAKISTDASAVMRSAADTLKSHHYIRDYQASTDLSHHVSSPTTNNYQLSTNPHGTKRALLLMIAFLSIFAVLSNTITIWPELRNTAVAIVIPGSLMAFLGIIHEFSGSTDILWIHQPRYGGGIYGPFTNNNHAAMHINMIFALALGLFLSRSKSKHHVSASETDKRIGSFTMLLLAMVILGGATCFSLSRGGIVALLGAIGLLSLFSGHSTTNRTGTRLKASILLIIAGTIWLGWEPVVNELGTIAEDAHDPLSSARHQVVKDTLNIFKDYPVFGCGFGSYQYLFPSYQSVPSYQRWVHAHNDWSQLAAEGGFVGCTLFLIVVIGWMKYMRIHQKNAAPRSQAIAVGTIIGILATAIYSFWEYGIHKPANGFLLMGLAGIAIAAISMRERPAKEGHKHHLRVQDATPLPSGHATRLAIVGLLLLASWTLGSTLIQLKGELAYTRFIYHQKLVEKEITPERYGQSVLNACREAETMYSLPVENPAALREISGIIMLWGINKQLDKSIQPKALETALNTVRQAVATSPSDYVAWLALARTHAVLGNWDIAEIYLEHARSLAAPGMPVRMFINKR